MSLQTNVNSKKNEIFLKLKQIIQSNINYNVKITQETEKIEYPCVVFTCRSNEYVGGTIDENKYIKQRSLGLEISIYSVATGNKTALEYNDEIANIIMQVMENIYNCNNGGKTADIANINTDKARQTQLNYIYNWYS